jgi:hypothetical protein
VYEVSLIQVGAERSDLITATLAPRKGIADDLVSAVKKITHGMSTSMRSWQLSVKNGFVVVNKLQIAVRYALTH